MNLISNSSLLLLLLLFPTHQAQAIQGDNVTLPKLHVLLSLKNQLLLLLVGQALQAPSGGTHPKFSLLHERSRCHNSPRRNKSPPLNNNTWIQNTPHTYQAIVPDGRADDVSIVSDSHVRAKHTRTAQVVAAPSEPSEPNELGGLTQ